MHLIVGLGNPGEKYKNNRHNAGFMLVDLLAQRTGARFGRGARKSLACRTSIEGRPTILAKPQTYMNLSGEAVRELLVHFPSDLSRLLILYDEAALPLGVIRIRRSGSAGGHNGMKSVIQAVGGGDFPRLRLGISPGEGLPDNVKKFVLTDFRKSEREALEEMLERAADAVSTILTEGVDRAMALYN